MSSNSERDQHGLFRLFVTFVDYDGPLLKISGQVDEQSATMVKNVIDSTSEVFDQGMGTPSAGAILEGMLCVAKYKDGTYCRAKVLSTANINNGLIYVHFIDYGNRDVVSLSTVRLLDSNNPLHQIRGQANDYYLARVVSQSGVWEEHTILKLRSLLCYNEYNVSIDARTYTLPIISIEYQKNDLSQHLVLNRHASAIAIQQQEILLLSKSENRSQHSNWSDAYVADTHVNAHVPFLNNQNYPTNPATAMRLQQSLQTSNYNSNYTSQVSAVTQRLLAHKVSRSSSNLRTPVRTATVPDQLKAPTKNLLSHKKLCTYKTRTLDINSTHKVSVSYAENGATNFAIQLLSDATQLKEMMAEINKRPYRSLRETPTIGEVCLGRFSDDRIISRAIVSYVDSLGCKLYFVDFGDEEVVQYYDIFNIPDEFLEHPVFAIKFCLSGIKNVKMTPHFEESFKSLVTNRVLTLKVVPTEGPPLVQYGELYHNNVNILDIILNCKVEEKLQFKTLDMLPLGSKEPVLVSYVDSCVKLFVQPASTMEVLHSVMEAVKAHCAHAECPRSVTAGTVCCAMFPDDSNWYRAKVLQTRGQKVLVSYVDYGNEQELDIGDLRTINAQLLVLPAVAMKCALKGYENKPTESKTSNQLEMLALEKMLTAHVVGNLSTDTMLVTLVDDSVKPPLDIAKRMMQLSQPRVSTEKPVTPTRKEAPNSSISSNEAELPDDRRWNYSREKSFKEDYKPRENNDFNNRSGSFRGKEREGRENFERGGSGRFPEKFGNSSRRPAPKPRETRDSARSGDDWDDSAGVKKKTKTFTEHQAEKPKGGWKQRPDGHGKKPASTNSSIQDRLKRDNKFEEPKFEKRDNRPLRRDNRGDRNFDSKERPQRRSNFSPRERAERSSNTSIHSGGSDTSHSSRAMYKPRGKFTQVQHKVLSKPVDLQTKFKEQVIELDSQLEVSVTWLTNPTSFYIHIMSLQNDFMNMMYKIPEIYNDIDPYKGVITEGASVLARYPQDGVLYRATIVSCQPFGKYAVQYIDFGNKFLVDAKDIWQLDEELMSVPKMAIHCSLLGVDAPEGEWKPNTEVDNCFNAPRYQCVFQAADEEKYHVSMWNNGVSVADTLVEKKLAVMTQQVPSVTLKDEPIDLTVVVGQEIVCRVTHVESYEKFFIQLDVMKADLVKSTLADYDKSLLCPLPAAAVVEGQHCILVRDEVVYRAILLSPVEAALPDLGSKLSVSPEELMTLPPELSVYYYQSLECCFNNHTSDCRETMTLDELKEALTGNKFILYINKLDNVKLVVTLYSLGGEKINVLEPDEDSLDAVSPMCHHAVFSSNFGNAYISHMDSLNCLYLHKTSDSDRLAAFLDEMFRFYEQGEPEALTTFETEGVCAAKSSDSNWYRARIQNVTENVCEVKFLDYGNTEEVPKDLLKKLDPKFYEPCAFALEVTLELTAIQDDALSKLTDWTNNKETQVTLSVNGDMWMANLNLDGVDLCMRLLDEKLAIPSSMEIQNQEAVPEEPVSLPPGCKQVYISHIDTPGQFWIQMVDNVLEVDNIQATLQQNYGNYEEFVEREFGTLCIAKYSVDDQWYRAEILDSDADITTVRFIDYGNTDVLDNQPGLLKVMPEQLKETERYCVKCSVNAVPTGTGQWTEASSVYFTELVGDLSVPVDALIVLKDVTTYVDIFVNGQNITDKLVSEGHATKSEEPVCGDLPSCFASHINSPSEFWIQLEATGSELQAMDNAMVDAEQFPELSSKEEGVLCAAKYPEDGAWYRAQIVVDGSEGTEVLFMDYGNASITTELRSLPEELQQKPALSRKCALQKPQSVKAWSRKSEVHFNELAADGATIFNVQFVASGDISIVELYIEGKSVTEQLVELCDEVPQTERPPPVGQDVHAKGNVCYVHSTDEFYVHLEELSLNLDKIMNELTNSEKWEVPELKVGMMCVAFSAEYEQWYRAKILEFCDVGAHIQFIDYGNKAKCELFRQLPVGLAEIEPIAKCCRLAGLNDNIDEAAKTLKFKEIVTGDPTFRIEFIDSVNEPNLVKLFLDDKDVATLLSSGSNTTPESLENGDGLSKEECDIDLNESTDSANTVIENKFYDTLDKEISKASNEESRPVEDKSNLIVSDEKSVDQEV